MIEERLAGAWKSGCARRFIFAVVAVFLFFGLCIASYLIALYSQHLNNLTLDQMTNLWMAGMGISLLITIIAIGIWIGVDNRRRSRKMDGFFTPLGLAGQSYLGGGRQYHGTLQGRQVNAYFYRGPSLDIYVTFRVNTRLGIGLKGKYDLLSSGLIKRPELSNSYTELSNLAVYPLDVDWARQLLDKPSARTSIARLANPTGKYEFRNILFQPGALQLQIHRMDRNLVTAENLSLWMSDLLSLVGIAETMQVPAVTANASELEKQTRTDRGAFANRILWITCGVLVLFVGILIAVLLFLVFRYG